MRNNRITLALSVPLLSLFNALHWGIPTIVIVFSSYFGILISLFGYDKLCHNLN